MEKRGPQEIRMAFPLSDGTRVEFTSNAPFTAATFAEVVDYFNVYASMMKNRAAREEAAAAKKRADDDALQAAIEADAAKHTSVLP